MMICKPHIAIIGAGNLGSRHLQGLTRIDRPISISVIDPNTNSLEIAKNRFQKKIQKGFVHTISYMESFQSLAGNVDLAIIASNSDNRRKIVEDLIKRVMIRYLLLEKVVFQSIYDFEDVILLLKNNNSVAWVNCPMRTFPFFKQLKQKIRLDGNIFLYVNAGNWNLASNAIHIIDLFSYLTDQIKISINETGLYNKIYDSQKKGFIEFEGSLTGKTETGDHFTVISQIGSNRPGILMIHSANHSYNIFQYLSKALYYCKENEWKEQVESYELPIQSEMTNNIVQQILDTGTCNLITLKESFLLHKPMLDAFNRHLKKVSGVSYDRCPIT